MQVRRPTKLHVRVQIVVQPVKCLPCLFLDLQIVFCAHDLSACSNAERWARANVRCVLAHMPERRVNSCLMELAVTAGGLTNQFEHAGDSWSSYLNFRVDKTFPQAVKNPRMGQYTPLVGGTVSNVREDKHGLERDP